MKSFISSLILTGALWVSIPMSAQRPMNERVHDKVATKEAPRIQFVGKKQGPNLFQSAAASVTADFSCQSAGSAITVWKEDFDDGTDGWTFTNAEDFSWTVKKITSTTDPSRDFSTYDPDDVQSLYIEGPYQSFKRGIAMATSGQIDVPANAMLKGYIGFTQNMDDYCRLQISVSADAFETSEILWNSADEDGEKPWRWHEFSVSLEKYSGRKIQIRFTYGPGKNDSFGTGGYMGDFAIDGLKITGVSTVEQVEAATGEVIAFADMSSGSPTAW